VDGKKLTEIINSTHENIKYLPGTPLPHNVIADPNLETTVKGANILIFVLPHQFLEKTCTQIKNFLGSDVKAISLTKGMGVGDDGPILLSSIISQHLGGVDCSVLMGANVANEVAKEVFSEATVGYNILENGVLFQKLFHASYFHVAISNDVPGVELCGATKNVVAVAAGLSDGLGYGGNTKAAVIRIGLLEMKKFARHFFPKVKDDTFFESCGIADLLVTCLEGRNRKVSEAFVKTGKSFQVLEDEMLNGQKLQGPLTSLDVHEILQKKNLINEYPLFNAVYMIAYQGKPADQLISLITENK